jgi:alanine racemase
VARVDLGALRDNVALLRRAAPGAALMAVVKADAYGHGMVPCARAAREAGAQWLGVAFVAEALALRAAGDEGRVLALVPAEGDDLAAALAADIDVSVSSVRQLDAVSSAAVPSGRTARVHLEYDSGLGRGGARDDAWADLCEAAVAATRVEVVGLWSHFARADEPSEQSNDDQQAAFAAAVAMAEAAGVTPEVRHLSNSAATLTRPGARWDLVRSGIALYGLTPGPALGTAAELGLRPVMTLEATVSLTKDVGPGVGVSYGHRYLTSAATRLALVPVGYGDGVPRHASGTGPLLLGGRRHVVAGRVCMDQFVVDVGATPVQAGDIAVLFGPGDRGEPTADEWGAACGTIGYEIVTRLGARIPREYVDGAAVGR